MKSFDASWTEDLIEDFDLVGELVANLEETIRKFGNINQSNLEILSEIWELLLILEVINHQFNNSWLIIWINFIDDLFLTVEMDRATHNDERCVESIITLISIGWIKEEAGTSDNKIVNAFLFTIVVDTHVTEYS